MSSSCGKRNREKGRKQKATCLQMREWLCGDSVEEGKGGRLLLLKGLNSEIQLWSPQPPVSDYPG